MTTREILRRPGFAPLAATYGLSELGDWLTTIALSVLVYDATHSAIATTVLFFCSKFLPAFVAPCCTVAFAVGPAVAGGTVAFLGAPATLLAGAAVFAVMALVARVTALPTLITDADEDGAGWWEKLARGVRHLRREPLVARMFGGQAALLVLFTMIPPIEVVYARHELGTTAAGLGALMAAWGAGAVAGSAIFARVSRGATLALALGASAAIGAPYLGMGLAGSLGTACVLSALGGVGNGMQWIAFVTAVQERVPGELQARAMALVEALGSAVPGLGFALGGILAAAFSARFAYVLAGAS